MRRQTALDAKYAAVCLNGVNAFSMDSYLRPVPETELEFLNNDSPAGAPVKQARPPQAVRDLSVKYSAGAGNKRSHLLQERGGQAAQADLQVMPLKCATGTKPISLKCTKVQLSTLELTCCVGAGEARRPVQRGVPGRQPPPQPSTGGRDPSRRQQLGPRGAPSSRQMPQQQQQQRPRPPASPNPQQGRLPRPPEDRSSRPQGERNPQPRGAARRPAPPPLRSKSFPQASTACKLQAEIHCMRCCQIERTRLDRLSAVSLPVEHDSLQATCPSPGRAGPRGSGGWATAAA